MFMCARSAALGKAAGCSRLLAQKGAPYCLQVAPSLGQQSINNVMHFAVPKHQNIRVDIFFNNILYYDQQMHNYFTNYHTATCFDTIVLSSGRL